MSFGPADLAASRRMKTTRVGGGHPGYVVDRATRTRRRTPTAPRATAQQDPWHYSIARMVDACTSAGILPFYGPFGDIKDVAALRGPVPLRVPARLRRRLVAAPGADRHRQEGLLARPRRGEVRQEGHRGDPRRPRRAHDRRQDAGRRDLEAVPGDGRARRRCWPRRTRSSRRRTGSEASRPSAPRRGEDRRDAPLAVLALRADGESSPSAARPTRRRSRPSRARATSVTVTGGDEVNAVRLFRNERLERRARTTAGIAAGPGCSLVAGPAGRARCDSRSPPSSGSSSSLGGGDDRARLARRAPSSSAPLLATPPLTADLGRRRRPALRVAVRRHAHRRPGRDELRGGGGDDTIDGGPGADDLHRRRRRPAVGRSGGRPSCRSATTGCSPRDGEGDAVRCGLGTDSVVADALDSSAAIAECERRDGLSRMTARIARSGRSAERPGVRRRAARHDVLLARLHRGRVPARPEGGGAAPGLGTLADRHVVGYRGRVGSGTIRVRSACRGDPREAPARGARRAPAS